MHAEPPSERNLEIYAEVTYQQRSWREVAAQFEISPARVGQIVSQVGAWLQATAPRLATSEDRQKQLAVTYQMHVGRLEHWIGNTVRQATALLAEGATNNGNLQVVAATRLLATAVRMSREQFSATLLMSKVRFPSSDTAVDPPTEPPSGGLAQSELKADVAPCTLTSDDDSSGALDGSYDDALDTPNRELASDTPRFAPWRAGETESLTVPATTTTPSRKQSRKQRRQAARAAAKSQPQEVAKAGERSLTSALRCAPAVSTLPRRQAWSSVD